MEVALGNLDFMRPLRVNRFKQDPAHCAIAACAAVANYYNKEVNYELATHIAHKEVTKQTNEGLYSGQIGLLLNHLGFSKVKVITCNLDNVDYAWAKMTKPQIINEITTVLHSRDPWINPDKRYELLSFRDFLTCPGFSNSLKIDHYFAEWIRKALDKGLPIVISFNWNMFFKHPNWSMAGEPDSIRGVPEYHAVVVRGYNDKEVHIVDSHWEHYKRRLKQYRDGYYTISWEELMTVMGTGDVIIPEKYSSKKLKYELV